MPGTGTERPPFSCMGEGRFHSAAEGAGRSREEEPWKELNLGLVCGETSQEDEFVAFHHCCREGTCEFLGESFSLWWSVNKHKMHVSFGSGFYSQMNEFE